MKKKDYILGMLVAIAAFISRAPLIEKYQSHWDGPEYTIGVIRFSYEQHTPTPSGYPLYISLGKFFYIFSHDPHKAILYVSVFGAILGAVILFFVGKKMYNRYVGFAASLLFLTGSTFYYFGLTPYGFELLFGFEVLLGYFVYNMYIKKQFNGFLFGLVLGIWFGIRPQELLQMFPLVLWGLYLLPNKERLKTAGVFFFITLLWLIPIVYITGVQKFITLWYVEFFTAILNNSFETHVELIIKGFLLSFGIGSAFLLYYVRKYFNTKNLWVKYKRHLIFYAVWILPGFFYNLFIRTEHAGYQMSYLSAFTILIAYALWKTTKNHKLLYILAITIIAIFNLYWFFYNRDPNYTKPYRPTSFHYSDIRKNDLKTGSKVLFVQKTFDPKSTLIVVTDVLWRPYSYYLKPFPMVVLFALNNPTGSHQYNYQRIDTVNWDMKWYPVKNLTVDVPKQVTTVVFMDDGVKSWIKNYPSQMYNLPGNSSIVKISVKQGAIIEYGYHFIKVLNIKK